MTRRSLRQVEDLTGNGIVFQAGKDVSLCRYRIQVHQVRIPVIVSASSGIVSSDSGDREHAVGAKRR